MSKKTKILSAKNSDELLDAQYGIVGTKKRDEFEKRLKSFIQTEGFTPKKAAKKKGRSKIIENIAYAAVIGLCEQKERERAYRGNGHHLAQQIATKIAEGFLSKQQKKIYEALESSPAFAQSALSIGTIVDLSSKQVAAQLQQINSKTLLLGSVKKGRYKFWYKHA